MACFCVFPGIQKVWCIILKAWLIKTDAQPVFHLKCHGLFTLCFRFDSSRLACRVTLSVQNRSGQVIRRGFTGSPGGLWPPRVMFSCVAAVNGGVHAGDSGRMAGVKPGIDRSYTEGPVTSESNQVRSPSGSHSQLVTSADIKWLFALWLDLSCLCVSLYGWIFVSSSARTLCSQLSHQDQHP